MSKFHAGTSNERPPRMDSYGVLEPLEGAVIKNLSVTAGVDSQRLINVPGDYSSLQSAIDALGTLPPGDTKIQIAANTVLTEDLDLSAASASAASKNSGEGSGLQIVGDTRMIAGMTYQSGGYQTQGDFVYDNPAAPTSIIGYNPPFGTRHGLINITAVGNTLTIAIVQGVAVQVDDWYGFPGTIVQPDFTQLGLVAGTDKVAIQDSTRAITIRTITGFAANTISVDGAAPTMDLTGSSVTFLPSVQIASPNLGNSLVVVNGGGLKFKGLHFYAGTNNGARNCMSLRDASVVLNNCVIDDRNHVSKNSFEAHNSHISGVDRSVGQFNVFPPAVSGLSANTFNDEIAFNAHSPNTVLGGCNSFNGFVGAAILDVNCGWLGGSWWAVANTQGWSNFSYGRFCYYCASRVGIFSFQCSGYWRSYRQLGSDGQIRAHLNCRKVNSTAVILQNSKLQVTFPAQTWDGNGASTVGMLCDQQSQYFTWQGGFIGSQVVNNCGVAYQVNNNSRICINSNNDTVIGPGTARWFVVTDDSHVAFGKPSNTINNLSGDLPTLFNYATDVSTIKYPNAGASLDNVLNVSNPLITRIDSVVKDQRLVTGAPTAFTLDPAENVGGVYTYVGREYRLYASDAQAYTVTLASGNFLGAGALPKTVATFGGAVGDGLHIRVTSGPEVQVLNSTNVVFA